MKLTLQNFQIHQKPTTVEIPEGETTYLEGDSDIGKSSRLRAMRWLCENKPDGGSFVTFKQPRGTTSVVTLEVNGHAIIRERGKSKNLYILDGEVYEAFGRGVPEPIQKTLRLSPYAFQLQGESPFLIGNSPSEAAKILSDACGLGVIDTAVGYVRGKKAVADAEIRKAEILLESAQRRLTDTERYLPAAGALEKAAATGEEAERLGTRCQSLALALDAEPLGQVLDVEAVRRRAAEARAARDATQELTGCVLAMRQTLAAEPQGSLKDVEAARAKAGEARVLAGWLADVGRGLAEMRAMLDAEPRGRVFDTEAARRALARAKALDAERRQLEEAVRGVREAAAAEPRGAPRDVTAARVALERARAMEGDLTALREMCGKFRQALAAEPQGTMLDTSELLKQRAQIKVCPTCGREL